MKQKQSTATEMEVANSKQETAAMPLIMVTPAAVRAHMSRGAHLAPQWALRCAPC